jgi:signal transduction histidine kinase
VVLVVLLTAVAVLNCVMILNDRYLVLAVAMAVLTGTALLVRPWQPAAPLTATAVALLWGWPMLTLLVVALYDLAAHRRARMAVGCAVVALGGNLLGPPVTSLWTPDRYAAAVFLPLLAVVGGLWLGNRRRLLQALAADVEHLRIEGELREDAARAAERSRIAMEMHDVLAHRLSLLALHSGVLSARTDTLPAPVVERLALLRATSTEALADLRDVLGALRGSSADDRLTPVITEVHDLVEQARAAGQNVTAIIGGHPEHAPTTHRLAAYRIVQEALTNARKHADGAEVTVSVDYRPSVTVIEVTNTAGTANTAGVASGYGLVGLRERVTTLGGQLRGGPSGAGAWRLTACIPHRAAPGQDTAGREGARA